MRPRRRRRYELLAIAELGQLSDLQTGPGGSVACPDGVRPQPRRRHRCAPVSETAPALLDAAKRLENLDDYAARETYLEAFAAIMYAGRLGEPGALADAAEAARVRSSRDSRIAAAESTCS